ncbi:abortive infection family protein [Streptococcus agalactiae]|uniref:abortive infection family protein n=1 Tax=Streptococcus agalactiae TaxID=1311 RepID=UPI002555F66C|nr:abortive infection family protein [Streptococcus agalactiae]MDK8747547.1 abortive infection family protein [Streptococcus agalactiae]
MAKKGPLTDEILIALAQLVDDAQQTTRLPSHSDLDFQINRFKLTAGDPAANGQTVGKAKRIRAVLSWALEHDNESGEKFVYAFISNLKAIGSFRKTSPNFVGEQAIINAQSAFKGEGYQLTNDGELRAVVLENLSEHQLEEALLAYIRRAKKGSEDAALLAGTGKDLLESVAAFILTKKWGSYPQTANFPTLLGQAFVALNLVTSLKNTPADSPPDQKAKQRFEASQYDLGCAVNMLRNKTGTGHGRPFISTISDTEAKAAIESMGIISEFLLNKLNE